MPRFWLIITVIAVAFMVYALVDCAMTDRRRVRGLRKPLWLLVVLLVPVIGGVLWFTVGRGGKPKAVARGVAPDDDPAFLRGLGTVADQDERIRRLEQELRDLDSAGPPAGQRGGTQGGADRDPDRDPDTDTDSGSDAPGRRDA